MIQVPASDVFDAIQLVKSLATLQPGETLDHKWAFVRREGVKVNPAGLTVSEEQRPESYIEVWSIPFYVPGWRIADPGQDKAEGLWRAPGDPSILATEIYDTYLMRKEGHLGD